MKELEGIIQKLTESLDLSPHEARAYLTLLGHESLAEEGIRSLSGMRGHHVKGALEGLLAKGFIIRAPSETVMYTALHPRMALTNAFKILQEDVMLRMKDRRMAVDRLARLLEPIYEKGRSVH